MPRSVFVYLLPALIDPQALHDGVAVAIDVLRATTTIVWALEAGAERVIPCAEIDEARQIMARLPDGSAVLGGERGGLKVPGFDLGNSPAEYTPGAVAGKTVAFTTTNGTRAILKAQLARRVVAGAFANLNAVIQWLTQQSGSVNLVCAGTEGYVSLEDVLCAGAIARGLRASGTEFEFSDDATAIALDLLENRFSHYDRFLSALRSSRGGRNLIGLGMDADIVTAARIDASAIVPELSRDPWQMVAAADARPIARPLIEPPPELPV
ncbi:MAG: 2-phosphosulfolactate phosphatase [Planctomycetaceae bacterium]